MVADDLQSHALVEAPCVDALESAVEIAHASAAVTGKGLGRAY